MDNMSFMQQFPSLQTERWIDVLCVDDPYCSFDVEGMEKLLCTHCLDKKKVKEAILGAKYQCTCNDVDCHACSVNDMIDDILKGLGI